MSGRYATTRSGAENMKKHTKIFFSEPQSVEDVTRTTGGYTIRVLKRFESNRITPRTKIKSNVCIHRITIALRKHL